jgi:signal transduction histidine kinase
LCVVGVGLWGLHRQRVAAAVRVERERARIAMDLHDELGSGLGSLAILADLAADDDVDAATRAEVAGRAAATARSLGDALSDIVWTLRRDAGSAESLARSLAERGARLFPGTGARFVTDTSGPWPSDRLSLQVYRNVQLVAVEALHNAARHAAASVVQLRLEPGRPWRLVVEDDGVGLGDRIPAGTGTGLASMHARAGAIHGRLSVLPREGGGTIVELRFDPQGRPWS